MSAIDINCDLGEGANVAECLHDARVMPYISSCNIACGGHAGDAQTMRATLSLAQENGLKVGAHPSYPDSENFGRKVIGISNNALISSLTEQIQNLEHIASDLGIKLTHIKFHGALYNQVEKDLALAQTLATWLKSQFPKLAVFGLAQGQFLHCCQHIGLTVIHEAFIDRAYQKNGQLVPRVNVGAVYQDISKMTAQACQLAKGSPIESIEGSFIDIKAQTLCLHGDNPNALSVATQLAAELNKHHIDIAGYVNDGQ